MAGIIKTEDNASEAGSVSEEERIRKLFQVCDGDGDGYIDSEDLLSICRKLNLEQCVGELMRELGADEQGRISYQGFLRRRLELAGQVEAVARCLTTTTEEGLGPIDCWAGEGDDSKTPLGHNSGLRQPEYRQPTSSENSLGAGSGGRQERWEFDSGARDLSPEPQASAIRSQQPQGPPKGGGPPSSQGPGVVVSSSPIPQGGGTASLLDMANKLHLAALSSLKSEIQDLTGQLKAVTQERDFLERSLSKAQLEKLRLVHDAEERLDSQAQRYEGRLTELHCVIAELSRKIHGQTSRVITEEEEEGEEESSTTAADEEEEEAGEEEKDGTGSQSVAADTTQDDLSGVCAEEEGAETQDCCELDSGRTELVDGEGTVVPDDATDNTHIHDLVVAQREEEEGLEQQRRLHRKVKELQGNLQQLQVINPAPPVVVPQSSTVPLKRPTPPNRAVGPKTCCLRVSGCLQRMDSSPRVHSRAVPPTTQADCHLSSAHRERSISASEMVDLGVCCNSRTAEHLVRDIREVSSTQELELAARCGTSTEAPTGWACAPPSQWTAGYRGSIVQLPMETPLGEQEANAPRCTCLPIVRALELEVERQASRAESHRASAELALLSLDECRCACERQALLLGRRGSDIVGLAMAIGYALPLCRATYILLRLLELHAQEKVSPGAMDCGRGAEDPASAMVSKYLPPELPPPCSKNRLPSKAGDGPPLGVEKKLWMCQEELKCGKEGSLPPSVFVVDEGGGYGKINRSVATEELSGGSSRAEVWRIESVRRALESEAATLMEKQKMQLLDMCECHREGGATALRGEWEANGEEWVLSEHDFLWLESLGVENEDGSPDMLRCLGRHVSVLIKKLLACGIGLHKARTMAAEASASEGELGLPPLDAQLESQRPPLSSPGGRKADLEVAVLLQELMAMREERAELRVRVHTLEGEREELRRLCDLLKPHHQEASGAEDVLVGGKSVKKSSESAATGADSMTMTSREQWLEGRLQELALALEQVATSADLRLRQSTAVMNDLRRTNGTLAHSLERCRRRYQQRLKTLEGQMESLVERHASQVRTLRQRISQLEERGGGRQGGGEGLLCKGRQEEALQPCEDSVFVPVRGMNAT